MTKEVEYLRARTKEFRELAEQATDTELKRKLIDLADQCEKLANHMGSNGDAKH